MDDADAGRAGRARWPPSWPRAEALHTERRRRPHPAGETTTAAADVATHVLRTIADNYAEATDLLRASRDLANAVPT